MTESLCFPKQYNVSAAGTSSLQILHKLAIPYSWYLWT